MRSCFLAVAFCAVMLAGAPAHAIDAKDWPTYNYEAAGSRCNKAETALTKANIGQLEEKWRFPPAGADLEIGAIHATPAVVNGYVYFGTVHKAAFYKLSPAGKVKWTFPSTAKDDRMNDRFASGVFSSALVTDDAVYFTTAAGFVYALDRESGKERWRVDMRGKDFPGAHFMNGGQASPILAAGKIIIASGAQEQVIARFMRNYQNFTGRGFVMALDAQSGKIVWKYDVGPKPERLDPPVKITDAYGEHVFQSGPATSSVWCTPSYDRHSNTIFFGTDANNSPRQPTADDPHLDTPYACAVIALDATTGTEKWVTQINPGDVWNAAMRGYDPKTGQYKDQSIGDTPKVFTITWNNEPTLVVGFGCKNGAFYVVRASDGKILGHTPAYTGAPQEPPDASFEKRTLALPGLIGGLQTGCATDGKRIYANGVDALLLGTQDSFMRPGMPTGGRVTAISLDTNQEFWRHERPKVASVAGPRRGPSLKDVGDPVASGIAVANDLVFFTTLMSSKLMTLDAATGRVLREDQLPPVWSGPAVSRGRVYVGTGNMVMPDAAVFGPTRATGTLFSYGLPGEDEVSRMGSGRGN